MFRVLIADKLETAGIDLLTKAGLEVDNRPEFAQGAFPCHGPERPGHLGVPVRQRVRAAGAGHRPGVVE